MKIVMLLFTMMIKNFSEWFLKKQFYDIGKNDKVELFKSFIAYVLGLSWLGIEPMLVFNTFWRKRNIVIFPPKLEEQKNIYISCRENCFPSQGKTTPLSPRHCWERPLDLLSRWGQTSCWDFVFDWWMALGLGMSAEMALKLENFWITLSLFLSRDNILSSAESIGISKAWRDVTKIWCVIVSFLAQRIGCHFDTRENSLRHCSSTVEITFRHWKINLAFHPTKCTNYFFSFIEAIK